MRFLCVLLFCFGLSVILNVEGVQRYERGKRGWACMCYVLGPSCVARVCTISKSICLSFIKCYWSLLVWLGACWEILMCLGWIWMGFCMCVHVSVNVFDIIRTTKINNIMPILIEFQFQYSAAVITDAYVLLRLFT